MVHKQYYPLFFVLAIFIVASSVFLYWKVDWHTPAISARVITDTPIHSIADIRIQTIVEDDKGVDSIIQYSIDGVGTQLVVSSLTDVQSQKKNDFHHPFVYFW